jgi:uncharacterized membrane protein
MNFPTTEHIPDNPEDLPPARRRRAHRLLAPLEADERAVYLDRLSQQVSPSFDFFLLSILSGFTLTIGLYIGELGVLVLGAALAPLMVPVVGVSLGTVIGSARFFLRSLIALFITSALVLFTGWLTGIVGMNLFLHDVPRVLIYAQISWLNLLVMAISVILVTIGIAGPKNKTLSPVLPSVAFAYQLYLPLTTAGLGLACGIPHYWPDGLVVFLLHLAVGILLGVITLAFLGFRPLTLFGYTLSGAITLLGIILSIGISSAGVAISTHSGLPTPIPSSTPTYTSTLTQTSTPVPPTSTFTPTLTPSLTPTPTLTYTPTATPVLAIVRTDLPEGVRIRAEPGGETTGFLSNNTLIILLPETMVKEGTNWVHVITPGGIQGWIVQSLVTIVTATQSAP